METRLVSKCLCHSYCLPVSFSRYERSGPSRRPNGHLHGSKGLLHPWGEGWLEMEPLGSLQNLHHPTVNLVSTICLGCDSDCNCTLSIYDPSSVCLHVVFFLDFFQRMFIFCLMPRIFKLPRGFHHDLRLLHQCGSSTLWMFLHGPTVSS